VGGQVGINTYVNHFIQLLLNKIQLTFLPFISSRNSLPQCRHTGNDSRHVAKNRPPCCNMGIKLTKFLLRDWILIHENI
jgi:hypothetical protein